MNFVMNIIIFINNYIYRIIINKLSLFTLTNVNKLKLMLKAFFLLLYIKNFKI